MQHASLVIHPVKSIDDAIDVSRRLGVTPISKTLARSLTSRRFGTLAAAYVYSTPAAAKYFFQFVQASANFMNQVPTWLLRMSFLGWPALFESTADTNRRISRRSRSSCRPCSPSRKPELVQYQDVHGSPTTICICSKRGLSTSNCHGRPAKWEHRSRRFDSKSFWRAEGYQEATPWLSHWLL